MAGCGGKKKYEEGGEVDKSKGVKGRTSAKAKKDQKEYQMGYKQGLKAAKQEFNLKGKDSLDKIEKANAIEKTFTPTKLIEGREKGASDMKAALKGQGAYKKGGKVKKGYHKMPDGKMMKDSAHKGMKKGGMVKRDGCAVRGKTKGRMV
jgi:hypothetical protein